MRSLLFIFVSSDISFFNINLIYYVNYFSDIPNLNISDVSRNNIESTNIIIPQKYYFSKFNIIIIVIIIYSDTLLEDLYKKYEKILNSFRTSNKDEIEEYNKMVNYY